MIVETIKNFLRFTFFILLQVTILKHLDLNRFFNPFLYVICILMLPIKMDKSLVMFIAFITGLIVDMFYNTMGMNAAACTFMAFCRPGVLRFYSPIGEYDANAVPTSASLGIRWMISYAGTLILFHHTVLFFLEALTFHSPFTTIAKIITSGATTLILVLIAQNFMSRND